MLNTTTRTAAAADLHISEALIASETEFLIECLVEERDELIALVDRWTDTVAVYWIDSDGYTRYCHSADREIWAACRRIARLDARIAALR